VTISEVLIASAITLGLMGSVFGVVGPLQRLFATQPEYADMHQRLRAALTAIEKDLLAAAPPVMPYRTGLRRHDPDAGVFYRADTITLVPVAWDPTAVAHTYYLKVDPAARSSQLMRYDGAESDVPLADHIDRLDFVYFDAGGETLPPETFQDGPWFPDETDRNRFDTDLLKVKRVRVAVRVQAAIPSLRRVLPDRTITLDVAPRNANHE
jgi:hypothetical protein